MLRFVFALMFCFVVLLSCINNPQSASVATSSETLPTQQTTPIKRLNYQIIKTHPHNPVYFTQGLFYEDGKLFEGTGLKGQSAIYVYRLEDNKLLKKATLQNEFFGEGITIRHQYAYQLTWQNHQCFVYDKISLKKIKTFSLPTDGWGLTHNDSSLIVSDGTATLYFYHPETFQLQQKITVKDQLGNVDNLNELEWIDGYIFANKWMTSLIYVIDPKSGQVAAIIDCKDLADQVDKPTHNNDAVLNGIAYNPQNKHLFLTGKLWSTIFEIQLF